MLRAGLACGAGAETGAKGGRHVAIYWDGDIRLEVGVELQGPFSAETDEVCLSATPGQQLHCHTLWAVPYAGSGARRGPYVVRSERPPPRWSKLGDLRALADGVGHESAPDSHGRVASDRVALVDRKGVLIAVGKADMAALPVDVETWSVGIATCTLKKNETQIDADGGGLRDLCLLACKAGPNATPE